MGLSSIMFKIMFKIQEIIERIQFVMPVEYKNNISYTRYILF